MRVLHGRIWVFREACAISGHTKAPAEMIGVLRPGARLILVDHIEISARVARAVRRALEIFTVPLGGEHFLRRRPLARSAPRD